MNYKQLFVTWPFGEHTFDRHFLCDTWYVSSCPATTLHIIVPQKTTVLSALSVNPHVTHHDSHLQQEQIYHSWSWSTTNIWASVVPHTCSHQSSRYNQCGSYRLQSRLPASHTAGGTCFQAHILSCEDSSIHLCHRAKQMNGNNSWQCFIL